MKIPKFFYAVLILTISMLTACTLPGDTQTAPAQSAGGDTTNTEPASADTPFEPTMAVVGPEEVVFDWTYDACDFEDIPDLPARAFRDADGNVHLIAAHANNRANVGPDLAHLNHQCDIIMNSDHDPDPAHFDDNEWIAAPYTEDGQTVYAVVHNEYHGWEHNDCSGQSDNFACWYNDLTLAVSHDGGQSFDDAAAPPAHFVAGLPYPYEAGAGPYGLLEPSNILKAKDGYYYQVARVDDFKSDDQWLCLNRTDDLSDPTSWRTWDGKGFNVQYISPYAQPDADPSQHLCAPLSPEETGLMEQSLTYNTFLDRYVLLGISADHFSGIEVWGIYYSFSEDLVHWTHRQLLWERELTWTWQPGDDNAIGYPTLIDPNSASMSFDTTDDQLYLYYTKYNPDNPLDRDLVRVPVAFFKTEAEAQAADTRTSIRLQPMAVTAEGVTVSGTLINKFGTPLSGKTVELLAVPGEGDGSYFQYQFSGRIPEDATSAMLGYRDHLECDCTDADSEFWLYDMSFVMGEESTNLVANPDFSKGLSGASLFNGANLARIEPSDRGAGNMLHVTADSGQTSGGNLTSFNVTPGETYTATFGAKIPPTAEGTGYFVIIFFSGSGESVRYKIDFYSPAQQMDSAVTGADGSFQLTWSEPLDQSTLQIIFPGDDTYLSTQEERGVSIP